MLNLFLDIARMSLEASWLILAVVLLRKLLKKSPKWVMCLMWALVAIRLVIPFSIEKEWSVRPESELVSNFQRELNEEATIEVSVPEIKNTIQSITAPVVNSDLVNLNQESNTHVNGMQIAMVVLLGIWMLGMVWLFVYAVISSIKVKRQLVMSVKEDNSVWICDGIATPFIYGMFYPQIYLPSSLNEADKEFVIAHENAHLERKDYIWKPLGYLILMLHWFNPFVWLAYILFCRDIEYACDEWVLQDFGVEAKKSYSRALINCSVSKKAILTCPLAFGEIGVKERVKHVLNYKKPALIIVLLTGLLCVIAVVCATITPVTEKKDYYRERMVECGEKMEYDGFTITLLRYTYDRASGTGCYELSIEKEGMDFRDVKVPGGSSFLQHTEDGKDYAWYLETKLWESQSHYYEIIEQTKDRIVVYQTFHYEHGIRSDRFVLMDKVKGKAEEGYVVDEIRLKEDQQFSIAISDGPWGRLFLSYDSVEIVSSHVGILDLSIGMDDGSEVVCIKDGKSTEKVGRHQPGSIGELSVEEDQNLMNMDLETLFAFMENTIVPTEYIQLREQIDLKHVKYIRVNWDIYPCE